MRHAGAAALLAFAVFAPWAASGGVAHGGLAMPEGFVGVRSARVVPGRGAPRLLINGQAVRPLIFFFNKHIPGERPDRYHEAQVRLAAQAGVHLYSFPLLWAWPRDRQGRADYSWADRNIETFVRLDPRALFILRVYAQPYQYWREKGDIPAEEMALFADGTRGAVSIASDLFWGPSNADTAALIGHFESGPLGPRILGYHIGGPDSEMFHDSYREKGPDYSVPNHRRFRRWLRERYHTDEALRRAWADPQVTLDTAAIPRFVPGRFPMHGAGPGERIQVFYDLPAEQNWVDFSAYSNEIVADRIMDWARLIKRETGGRKLSVFFYGYTLELPGSFSGHHALQRVLACPEVDVLVAPYSYGDRLPGGSGSFMSPVDSVVAHGKLWLNEDDTRTHLLDSAGVPQATSQAAMATRNMDETLGVLGRNLGALVVHRAGTWWMDLVSAGAFNHPDVWRLLQDRYPFFDDLQRRPSPYRPDVAVLVDERSKHYVKSDWEATALPLYTVRDESVRSGASVGYYTLDDFISGVVPRCRAYVFAHAFRLSDRQVAAIRARLDREGATAVWCYAPGLLAPAGRGALCDAPDVGQSSRLTGMRLVASAGRQASTGEGLLAGLEWAPDIDISPRLSVADPTVRVLGRYRSDGAVSAAEARSGRHRSIFLGSMGVTAELLRRLYGSAGAHIWARGSEVVHTDGRVLVVHSAQAGVHTLFLPRGVEAEAVQANVVGREGRALRVRFRAAETVWFRLRRTPAPRGRAPDGRPDAGR